jgi:protein tyrosine phosphatase
MLADWFFFLQLFIFFHLKAVISVLVIVFIVVVIVIGLKVKKNDCFLLAKNSTNTMAKHHHLSRQMNDDDEDDDGDQLDNNKATLIPPIQTNTTTSTSSMVTTSIYNNNNNGQSSTMYNPKSATISPHVQQQQQYLSATLHRNHHHNQMVGTMGLLTTVHNNTPQTAESLYTSIDATQRQHLLSYGTTSTTAKALFSTYDPHTGTLNNQTSSTHGTLPHCHNPIEDLKRLNSLQAQQQQQQQQPIGQKTLVKLDDLSDYIDTLKQNQNERFQAEYESIEPNEQFTWENSTKDYNRHKNRYANVIAYDHSRVVLAPLYDHHTRSILVGSDYINANFIDGFRRRNAYIATQGPLPSTYTDFWRMVWEQNTSIIVMMTKLEERNRLKCDQYWPNKAMDVYGNLMQVTLVDITELATYTIRTFILARIGSNEPKREIKQFQYTAWPDHGVPEPTTSFLVFLRRIAYATASVQQQDALMGPVVVHCSAGVGRTGCFVVVNAMLERAMHDQTIDVYDYVTQLRAQRNYMVQTEDQYQFCYDAILEVSLMFYVVAMLVHRRHQPNRINPFNRVFIVGLIDTST